jgi:divalent metal cation (Fe/Co/Zn/Cd) transporter
LIILVTAYRILRSSIAGIMDEADTELLQGMIATLEKNRRENWIDLHNLRIIKYGSTLHLDFHLTMPWYFNLHEAHREIDAMTALLQSQYGDSVEFFVHSDGCLDFSCAICSKQDCSGRQGSFVKKVEWTMTNVLSNEKHRV